MESKYKEVYLLRNEEVYKIFDFKKGRGFQPDFILFLKTKDKKEVGVVETELYYQIFIEPKGNQFKDKYDDFKEGSESWKEEFLKEISTKYGTGNIIKAENKKYKLIGLPFYNEKNEKDFEDGFSQNILGKK